MSLLYVHENNIQNKIRENYNGRKAELEEFYLKEYLPTRLKIEDHSFNENSVDEFKNMTKEVNEYRRKLSAFANKYDIKSQSKFESTFLEELSVYLFENFDEIKNEEFGIYNKGIYAGLKIGNNKDVRFITKDVDFCIGKKAIIRIDNKPAQSIILPIVAVEVKTYLDATMFGEIKSSSKTIRSASPSSQTYVLMGYKSIKDEHIIASRQDATLSEMFCLQDNENDDIHWEVLYEYWKEIKNCIKSISVPNQVNTHGKLLRID
ncbi:MAG: Bpu10I family restriction endonuclease [Erysipelotrichaceae bacterium]|nr:Bpu10I family restriction endonuclease [Erysipelotrichaceae bacterium]